jgi:hypothetical protein
LHQRLRQESGEFWSSLSYTERPCLKKFCKSISMLTIALGILPFQLLPPWVSATLIFCQGHQYLPASQNPRPQSSRICHTLEMVLSITIYIVQR